MLPCKRKAAPTPCSFRERCAWASFARLAGLAVLQKFSDPNRGRARTEVYWLAGLSGCWAAQATADFYRGGEKCVVFAVKGVGVV
jgi:hypothetical protein